MNKDSNRPEEVSLFQEYRRTQNIELRNQIAERYLSLAQMAAKKFSGRGVDYEDLVQVASLSLIKSIERFDPDKGIPFPGFALPTMVGEIKNYFRDKTRMIHLSRRDSEQLKVLSDTLTGMEIKGERVTAQAVAQKMNVPEERILELLEMQKNAVGVESLDENLNDEGETELSGILGEEDSAFLNFENREFIRRAMQQLDKNERRILYERFWKQKSQKDTAKQLGISQMSVSRTERKILEKLRRFAEDRV